MKTINCIFFVLCLLVSLSVVGNTIFVNDQYTLNIAIDDITPGDTIVIANNEVPYVDLSIIINEMGTADNPIVVIAETVGCVKLTGNSRIEIGGSYIVIDGLSFVGIIPPVSDTKSIIEFRESGNEEDWCNNCRLTNVTFNNLNRVEGSYDTSSSFHWIRVFGQNNEIDHCNFLNKHDIGNSIVVDRSVEYELIEESTRIHHNYFANRTQVLNEDGNIINGQEAVRIGNSASSLTNANCEVYNNYFYNWIGEAEIVSSKSGGNKFYNNTFRACYGALSLRHGENCDVYGNFFIGRADIDKSGGVRIIDSGHRVYNNYFQDLTAGGSKELAAIYLSRGDFSFVLDDTLSGYGISEDILVAHNTIVNCDRGIWICPPKRYFASGNIEISNNLLINCSNAAIVDTLDDTIDPAPEIFLFGDNIFTGNIKQADEVSSIWSAEFDIPLNLETTEVLTTFDGNYNSLVEESLAINFGQLLSSPILVTTDITGGTRTDGQPDVGATEFGITAGNNRPYTREDVGFIVGVNTSNHRFRAKVLLQAAYMESGTMNSLLTNNNLLPTTQPYNQIPWNYDGTETIVQLPADADMNIVDWLLIEALDQDFNIVERRAGLLTNNGYLVDTNGEYGIKFCSLSNEVFYHFLIRHRNHIDVISSTSLSIGNNIAYDFTNPANILMGAEQLINQEEDIYSLIAGDVNANGIISVADFNTYISSSSILNTYSNTDVNMDGNTSIADFNLYMQNASKIGVAIIRY